MLRTVVSAPRVRSPLSSLFDSEALPRVEDFKPRPSWERDEFFSAPTAAPVQRAGRMTDADREVLRRHHFMAKGRKGDEVKELQTLLAVETTGVFDDVTDAAVRTFQTNNGLRPDGTVGQETWGKLLGISNVEPGTWLLQPDIRVVVESYRNRGDLAQMSLGTIIVNGNTYRFRCGGFGRGSIPLADYNVTPHLWSRDEPPYTVDGVGWSFAVSDKMDDRVGAPERSLLRIHPDGGTEGTHGCIGIVGNGDTMTRFREDMRAMFEQYGESLMMRMGSVQPPALRA